MHHGNIHRDTAAARVYDYLSARQGRWVDAMEIALACRTTALSTRVSEVRKQVQVDGLDVTCKRTVIGGEHKHYYRLADSRRETTA